MLVFFASLIDNAAVIGVLSIVLFLVIALLSARQRFAAFLMGIVHVIVSLVSSPFGYLRAASRDIADAGKGGTGASDQEKHYLLSRLPVVLQTLLLVIATIVLAIGLADAYGRLHGPKEIRDLVGSLEEETGAAKAEVSRLQPQLNEMNASWEKDRAGLISSYVKERDQRRDAALAENKTLAESFTGADEPTRDALTYMNGYQQQVEDAASFWQIDDVHNEIMKYLDQASVPGRVKQSLLRYNDNWFAAMGTRIDTVGLTDEQMRSLVQPALASMKAHLQTISESLPAQEEQITQLKSQLRPDVGGALFQAVWAIVGFLAVVWLFGLAIEWLSVSIHVAADVRKIQQHLAQRAQRELV